MKRDTKRAALLSGIIFLIVCGMVTLYTFDSGTRESPNVPTFTSTSTWDPALLEQTARELTTAVSWDDISLPPPPEYGSVEMQEELETLQAFMRARTVETYDAIVAEQDIQTATIAGYTVAELLYPETPTALSRLLSYGWEDLATITLAEKKYFDRVRPHMADSRIVPMIDVPRHPAYPSGHSAQSHYLALVLGLVYPEVADELMLRADEIAIHREIAGVHYPSDTDAGAMLAQQFVNALQTDPVFQQLLTEAREEARNQ